MDGKPKRTAVANTRHPLMRRDARSHLEHHQEVQGTRRQSGVLGVTALSAGATFLQGQQGIPARRGGRSMGIAGRLHCNHSFSHAPTGDRVRQRPEAGTQHPSPTRRRTQAHVLRPDARHQLSSSNTARRRHLFSLQRGPSATAVLCCSRQRGHSEKL